eukprot:s1529_g15.t1
MDQLALVQDDGDSVAVRITQEQLQLEDPEEEDSDGASLMQHQRPVQSGSGRWRPRQEAIDIPRKLQNVLHFSLIRTQKPLIHCALIYNSKMNSLKSSLLHGVTRHSLGAQKKRSCSVAVWFVDHHWFFPHGLLFGQFIFGQTSPDGESV